MGLSLLALPAVAFFVFLWAVASWHWLKTLGATAGRGAAVEWFLLAAVPLLATAAYWPYLHNGIVGVGDAYHYSLQVADVVTQARQGNWPIVAGDSIYAFNGNVHTVRTAPFFTHFAAVLDLLSAHSLAWWQLTNFSILLSAAMSGWFAYLGARWVAPRARTAAALLALLYVTTPAVATPLMNHDMVATFLAAPWLPLVWASTLQVLRGGRLTSWCIMAGATALTWQAHPPTALWITPVVGLAGIIAVVRWPIRETFRCALAAAVLFVAVGGYVFYSAMSLSVPEILPLSVNIAQSVYINLQTAWPAAWKPLDLEHGLLGNIQLGYALSAALLLGAIALRPTRRQAPAWFALAFILLLFGGVIPVPGFTIWFWNHMPNSVQEATNVWPMQRVYQVIAAGVVVFAAIGIGRLLEERRTAYRLCVTTLLLGLVWSTAELTKLQEHATGLQQTTKNSRNSFNPHNALLTRSSYALFDTIPAYFSHGYMNAEDESRILDLNQDVAETNISRLEHLTSEGATAAPVESGSNIVLNVGPDQDYLFSFKFPSEAMTGEATLKGEGLMRVYALPSSGGPASVGSGPTNAHSFRLFPSKTGPLAMSAYAPPGTLITALRFNRSVLPVKIKQLTPYTAEVLASKEGYLETPMVYLPGYTAKVDGEAVNASRSPEGLVSVKIPAGHSIVTVSYDGPPGLRLWGWFATAGIIVFLLMLLRGPKVLPPAAVLPAGSLPTRADDTLETPAFMDAETPSLAPHVRPADSEALRRNRLRVSLCLLAGITTLWFLVQFLHSPPAPHGSIRLDVRFPRWTSSAADPLVVTGNAAAADALYVQYLGKTAQLGVSHLGGANLLSEPFPVVHGRTYSIEYESPALESGTAETSKGRVRVLLDGKVVIDAPTDATPSDPDDLRIGRNTVMNVCSPRFTGWIKRVP
jgi:hypothetical protein